MSENIKSYTIKELADEDRPREKLVLKGRQSLTNAELIAILIGSGNREETAVELAQRILVAFQNDLNVLGKLSVHELVKFKGIGEAKAVSIIAALELGRRRQQSDAKEKIQMRSSKDIFDLVYPMIGDLMHEEFWVLYLNKANKLIEAEKISAGGLTGTVVDVKIIMNHAVQKLASAIALSHNHPSGNLQPSDADISLTRKMKDAGKFLDILVIDHLIIGDKNYYSFADNGLL